MFCQERRVCMVGLLNLSFDLWLKIAVFDCRLAEEGKILHPTLISGHISRVAAGETQFVLENAITMKIWPYNPGGRWRGGRIRRGLLYMHQVAECIKYLQSSICTQRAVY